MPSRQTTLSKYYPQAGGGTSRDRTQREFAKLAGKAARKIWNAYTKSKARKTSEPAPTRAPRAVRRAYNFTVAQQPHRTRYAGARNAPSVARMREYDIGQDITRYKRPVKGNYGSKGTIVVNKPKGKKLAKQCRKFDQSTYTTAFIGSTPRLDEQGNMGHLDERYTFPSVSSQYGTGWFYNVGGTSNYWNPMEKGRIGNQTIEATDTAHNNFYLINAANTDCELQSYMIKQTKLPETSTPFNTGTLPVEHIYRVPNTVLASVDLNLSFSAASVQDNLVTIQVLRATPPEPIIPGDLGHDQEESPFSSLNVKKMLTNTRQRANGHFLQVLYSKTFVLPGINLNAKQPKTVFIRKKVKMNYMRSTCRRTSAATENNTLAGQWKPQFAIDNTGAQFNNVYVRAMATCITKTAKANMMVGAGDDALGTASRAYTVPTFHNMDSSTTPFEYTDMKNARFRYGGTIGVKHYCQEISRGFGNSQMSSFVDLQNQINELQVQLGLVDDANSCHSGSDCSDEGIHTSDVSDDEDCGSGHQAGASPPGDGHSHPNSLTAEEHDANCQHSH